MQFQHRPDDSAKVDDIQYQLNGAVCDKLRAQKTAEFLQSQVDSVRDTVDSYKRVPPNIT